MTTKASELLDQAMDLSVDERRDLAQALWETTEDDVELTDELKAELDRRLERMERDPGRGIPLEEFVRRMEDFKRQRRSQA